MWRRQVTRRREFGHDPNSTDNGVSMLPIVIDVRGRTVLVVGAGRVGRWKATAATAAGGRVRLVDPDPTCGPDESALIDRRVESYSAAHLDGVVLVFACATAEVNATVVADARARGVWVCDSAESDRGDFHLPGVVRRGELTIAVSTRGAAPALAARITNELAVRYDDAYADWVRVLAAVRTAVMQTVPGPAVRRELLCEFAEPVWLDRIRTAGPDVVLAEMLQRVAAV
jgi:precorrin-2 dehydrogenase/sirohydrochlorin ferrochelatase